MQPSAIREAVCVGLAAAALWAQSFAVASIKPHPPAPDRPIVANPGVNPIRISGPRVDLEMISLRGLIMAAYNVQEYQVADVPKWATGMDALYDISAKAEGDAPLSMESARAMLRTLLADRFQLKLRREERQLPVYNLTVGKGGLRLAEVGMDAAPAPGMRRGSMEGLAAALSVMLQRPVIDRTGISGTYAYPGSLLQLDVGAHDPQETAARVLAAIQEYGLRVTAAKAAVQMLVIESAERPSAN